jgi:exopolyphosphatase/guanosine-5'-triphosphate,3'-diphosphate pyrophosphatase
MRLAAIDIGTNSIHMIVAEVRPDGSFEVIDREKEMIRLGTGGLGGLALGPETMAAGLDTLSRFSRLAQSRGVDETVAVATSAVREAPNGGEFLAEVARRTGIRPRVISGAEEARLIYKAAIYGVESATGRTVVIDVGGGSVEVAAGNAAGVKSSRSFKLGVSRLTERFVKSDPITKGAERRMAALIEDEAGAYLATLAGAGFTRVIATSGTMLSLGEIALGGGVLFGRDTIHHARLAATRLHEVRRQLAAADMRARLRVPGLDSRRADLVVAGAVLADTLVRLLGAEAITLCDLALREGLVLEFIARNGGHIAQVERYPDIRRRSLVELAERCGWQADHTQQVVRLSLSIFDQTRAIHGLEDRAREWLEFAALVHDIGGHISYTGHHKHTDYLVRHGDLRGFEPAEIQVIALIARFHRKAAPGKSHAAFASLPPALRRVVRVASAILRVAECLDRSHAQIVRRVKWRRAGDSATLLLRTTSEAELEVWAARRQIEPLQRALGTRVQVEAGDTDGRNAHHAPSPPGTPVRRRGHRRIRQDDAARPAGEVARRKRAAGVPH